MAVRFSKPKATLLVKWLAIKCVEKVVEETEDTHQEAITEKGNTLALIKDDVESQREIAELKQNNCRQAVAGLHKECRVLLSKSYFKKHVAMAASREIGG